MNLLYSLCLLLFSHSIAPGNAESIDGAWIHQDRGVTSVLLFSDGYFTATKYTDTSFVESMGGPYSIKQDQISVKEEFNTSAKNLTDRSTHFELRNGELYFGDQKTKFKRVDSNGQPLSGVWKITKRMQEGSLVSIQQRGTRKTLKLLTGTRFQWFAIDPATNSFSGSGGGTYSFSNGKYVENIEFFSRDASRIGASLSFDDHVENGEWHHTGLSSKGDKIYEVWGKVQ